MLIGFRILGFTSIALVWRHVLRGFHWRVGRIFRSGQWTI